MYICGLVAIQFIDLLGWSVSAHIGIQASTFDLDYNNFVIACIIIGSTAFSTSSSPPSQQHSLSLTVIV